MEYNTIYLRDDERIGRDEWTLLFDEDLSFEPEYLRWPIHSDISNGRRVIVGGHMYQLTGEVIAENPHDIVEIYIDEGKWDELHDAILLLSDNAMKELMEKLESVRIENGRYIMEESK